MKNKKRIDLTRHVGEALITRDGRRVIRWRGVRNDDTFLPIEAVVESKSGKHRKARYTHFGNRYINVSSPDDLILKRKETRCGEVWKYDTMPEPLRAIECIRQGDYHGARAVNKHSINSRREVEISSVVVYG